MQLINKETIASVELAEIKVSEDELGVYEAALSYALCALSAAEINERFGASVDELEGMRDDLREALAREQQRKPSVQQPPVAA